MQKIQIIDDDPLVRRQVGRALSHDGYDVIDASDPSNGMELAIREKPDLILLDVLMPGMDGISVLRKLRHNPATRSIPVIIVTSLGSEEQVAACLEEGAVDLITKPFSHRLLCERVASGLLKDPLEAGPEKRMSPRRPAMTGTAAGRGARVVAFVGVKGGVGTTTLAANAAAVAVRHDESIVLCEMLSTFGSLSAQLNAQPRDNLSTLTRTMKEMSFVAWDGFLIRDSSGVRILFGPQPEDGDISLTAEQVLTIIAGLSSTSNLIFLDLGSGLSALNCEIIRKCDRVVVVLDCEPTSVAAAQAIVDQLQQVAIRQVIKAVVVSRTELSMAPKIDEIRSQLGCDVIGSVPRAADEFAYAVKTGATLASLHPEDVASAAIRELVEEHLQFRSANVATIG